MPSGPVPVSLGSGGAWSGALAPPTEAPPRRPPRPRHSARGAFDVPTRQLPKRLCPAPSPRAHWPLRRSQRALRPPRSGLGAPHPGLAASRAGSAPRRAQRTMPQLDSGGGGAGAGDDLGAPDELLAFQDEGEEQDDKNRDSAAGPERDLAELKSSLVNESEGAAAGAGVSGPGVRVLGEAEGAPEVSLALYSPEGLLWSWDPAGPPSPASMALVCPISVVPRISSAPHGPSASLCRPWDESTLRRDFSRTNFQSP